MILPVWKKIGGSTHILAQRIGKLVAKNTGNPEHLKATHTGTLDPMAEGVVIVLTGEDRLRKSEYSQDLKTYEFEIIFGVSTDSHDLLGLTQEITEHQLDIEKMFQLVLKELPHFLGKQKQVQPAFSAQRVEGKSGFDLATENKTFNQTINDIEIHSIVVQKKSEVLLNAFEKKLIEKINLIEGDFRQSEILARWKKTIKKLGENSIVKLPILTLQATVSKRTYIRAITRDLSKKIGVPVTTLSIVRTINSGFDKKSCQNLL